MRRKKGVRLPLMFSPRVGVRAVMWRVSDPHLHTHRTYTHHTDTVEPSNIDTNRAEESVHFMKCPYFRGRNACKSGTRCGKRCPFRAVVSSVGGCPYRGVQPL